jgi:hypothetical protein
MSPSRHLPPYTHNLLKVLASYLAVVLLVQALAAAFALGAGPLHRHRPLPASVPSALFSHHDHAHADGRRHHHAASDSSAALDAAEQEAADAARLALTAALSLMALRTPRYTPDLRRHVMRAAPVWSWQTVSTTPLYRPPNQG